MTTTRLANVDQQDSRRELRTRIARLRRRLDGRAERVIDRLILLVSWRSYVEKYPARSMLAAAGLGMALSCLAIPGRRGRRLGEKLADLATGAAWPRIWNRLHAACSARGESAGARRPGVSDIQSEETDA